MLAERLKAIRLKLGLSQSELAKRAGIHPVTICEWEKGATDGIKLQSVQKLAAALGALAPTGLVRRGVSCAEALESLD